MKVWKLAMLWAPLGISACSDAEIAPTAAVASPSPASAAATDRRLSPASASSRYEEIGAQMPPTDVPSEYQSPTSLSVTADLGMSSSNAAYAQSRVNYLGTDAIAEINLEARSNGTVVANSNGIAQNSSIFPFYRSLTASTTVSLPANCGIILQATARGEAWIEYLNPRSFTFSTWGRKKGSDPRSLVLPICPPEKDPPCSVLVDGGGALADCDVPAPPLAPAPVGGGDESTPPPSNEPPPPEPEPYREPFFMPAGHWEQIWEYNSSTYEWQDRWIWIADNPSRLPLSDAPVASSTTPSSGSPRSVGLSSGALPSVYVIVSGAIPAGALAVVERHRQGPYKNVLLVPSANVRPAVFVAAMRFLYDARATHGENSSRDVSSELRGDILDRHIAAEARANAATFTAMLGKAKQAKLGKYGTRKVLHLQMESGKRTK